MENTPIQEVKKLVLDFIEKWQEQGKKENQKKIEVI
jgi:hypothetical protein